MKEFLLIIVSVVIISCFSIIGIYNGLQVQTENVDSAYAQVDNQLKRRNDLIPNLVSVTKGYASHEKEVFAEIAKARSAMSGANTIKDKAIADKELTSALSRLLVVVENYPNLKADKQFIQLSDELAGTENRIAIARKDYNDQVKNLNKALKTFPTNIIGAIFNVEKRQYFETNETEKAVPTVTF